MSEIVDVTNLSGRALIAEKISYEIDNFYEQQRKEPYRTHLGWSVIGHACDRHIFQHFRWFKANFVDGRSRRLLNRGDTVESEIRRDLKAIGCQFIDTVDLNGKQIKVSNLNGHFGGSCDGIFIAPHLGLHEPTLLEAKSSGTGAKFNNLLTKRVEGNNYQHFVQQSGYGKELGIKYCLYVVENKNDSDRYYEMVELDYQEADDQINRAFHIITSDTLPAYMPKASANNPICKSMCGFVSLCFGTAKPDINCRSCANSQAVVNSEWLCRHFNQIIPKEFIALGCPEHKHIEE